MKIELTEQQRQVVQEQAGEPVEVIDPATQCAYILLAREQFDRMRSWWEASGSPATGSLKMPRASPQASSVPRRRSGATCHICCHNESCSDGGCATTGTSGSA